MVLTLNNNFLKIFKIISYIKKQQRNQMRERERERKSSTKSNQSSIQNSFVIPHESVLIPMGTKDSIDKMLAYRTNPENNAEEILVKYKVLF